MNSIGPSNKSYLISGVSMKHERNGSEEQRKSGKEPASPTTKPTKGNYVPDCNNYLTLNMRSFSG